MAVVHSLACRDNAGGDVIEKGKTYEPTTVHVYKQ